MKPFPGLIGAVGGQRWELDVERAGGSGLNRGGATPKCWGSDEGVGKHLWKVEKLAGRADLEEMGRRRRSAAS